LPASANGGSLGARTINESVSAGLEKIARSGIQLIWQTGKHYAGVAEQAMGPYRENGIQTFEFIPEMDLAYAAADVIVSRAGAISISELCIVQKPVILVPSPNVAEDHQTRNAMALVSRHAALMVTDREAPEILIGEMISLISDKELCTKLQTGIAPMGRPDAAEKIASVILELVK
jgi:UDP-N-acetylglucosamine--N-acetylmuramyl-(pentapeptide) pyrophosphoryl-undecaprenol N-acetylglucosamine transferase